MRITGGQVFDLKEGFIAREVCTDGTFLSSASGDSQVLDASGCYVIPGLIDVHFHGCVGEDFSDATSDGLQKIADYELSRGITYICPAGMTLPEDQLTRICENAAAHKAKSSGGADLAGLHLEGPFLCDAKKGAQNGAFLHDPDIEMLRRLQRAANGLVKLVTVAPEQPHAGEFIRSAAADGITVSIGHTTADYEIACAAMDAGASHCTHLFNAMPSFTHRAPGVVGAAFDHPAVKVELICDGIHIHPSVVRAVFRLFGAERVVLVSDSLRATGMPDGQYPFGGQEIVVHGNRATLAHDPNTLAGSVTDLMGCLRQAVSFGIPLADAVRAAAYNPAQAIGIDDRAGSLEPGKEASLVLLDQKDLSIRSILFRGTSVKR
ncbi:N-acetylglucosamine-6-phosphate deacetylase [uncultured Dysosmobacter sp.]|uniref:N-acetylglucosamine-6-phosphate deacetylase n=1 Tax=uncultured Dysosmobacter sp. TaxID=2591384 RepID=UPI00260449FB|nr:N-acetylglucosamine-6-phosphate deacetylase [uncultured Dysosmobacter sp.]